MTVAGFGDRAEAIARAEERAGRPMRDLDWHETFALARGRVGGDPPRGAVRAGRAALDVPRG